jgi:hypothetical protein
MKTLLITAAVSSLLLSSCTLSYTQTADGDTSLNTEIFPIPVEAWKK